MVTRETDRIVELQTPDERLLLDQTQIEERKATAQSLMPEGQLDTMTTEQIVNLFAYLISNG